MNRLKTRDWVFIAIMAVSLIGCIFTVQTRSYFLYAFVPLVFAVFFYVEGKMKKSKLLLVKMFILFLVMMFILYCAAVFTMTSSPIQGVRDIGSEKFLMGLDSMQSVTIPTLNGNMDGWLYKQSDKKAPLIIFFNGAGECSAKTLRKFYEEGVLSEYFAGCNLLCTDYPSYGLSEGDVSEAAMKRMAIDTFDTAVTWDFVDTSAVTAIGYSIGTGPASYLASRRDLASLVLLAPYDEHWELTLHNAQRNQKAPVIKKTFYRILWGYNVDPYDYAKSIDEPVLIIASTLDTTITHASSMRVAERIKNCKVVTLTDVRHEHLLSKPSYETIKEFLYL